MSRLIRTRSLLIVIVIGLTGIIPAFASASTTYLRPNSDVSLGPWSVIGASTASDALDDNVTPSDTPTNADYVSTSRDGALSVEMQTSPLAGMTSSTFTAWYYTPTKSGVRLEVFTAEGTFLGKLEQKTVGWHSLKLSQPTQWGLDNITLNFTRLGGESPKIYAAFIQFDRSLPSTKVYWGAWIDGEVYGRPGDAPWDDTTWTIFGEHVEKPVSIVHFGQPAPWNQNFKSEPLKDAIEKSAIPMMDMDSDGVTLSALNSGSKDGELKKWAEEVKEYGKPFFFRWQWEMNLLSTQLGSEASKKPKEYVEVWQRFHNIADSVGATNITWVWCPNVIFSGSTPLKSLYPGNKYVDWTCMDGYNHGTKTSESGGWKSFNSVFSETYSALTSKEFEGNSKPIMIGETASTEAGGSKPEWIAEGLGNYLPNNFPGIKAVLWFNWNITEGGTEWDWPIESSAASTASFANAISSPYYAENTFKELEPLTRIQPLP
jgi:hypothetical protein